MNLNWQKFENFFALYELLKDESRMFYIIGETHHCYIGSVGGRKGVNGLSQRYQKQYVDRSKAIFGSSIPSNQPAFASIVTDERITINDIEPIERQLQDVFIGLHGKENALFTPRGKASNYQLTHSGDAPSFLKNITCRSSRTVAIAPAP
jgi:hypothetical protein